MNRVTLIISLSAIVATAPAQSLRKQIVISDKMIRRCMITKDIKGFTKVMKGEVTSDFVYVEGGRKMGFDQMVQGIAQGFSQEKAVSMANSKILSLSEKGNTATATTMHVMESTIAMGDAKPHKMSFSGVSSDTYVKQGAKWKLSKMAWVKQTMLLDGKPMGAAMSGSAKTK